MKSPKLERFEDWLTDISSILIFVLMIITVIDVIGRYFFNHPLKGTVEICQLLLVVAVTFPLAAVQRRNEHIGMNILLDRFKKYEAPIYIIVQSSCLFLVEMIFIFALVYCVKSTLMALQIYDVTEGPLYVAIWPAKALLCLGIAIMSVRVLIQLIEVISSLWCRAR